MATIGPPPSFNGKITVEEFRASFRPKAWKWKKCNVWDCYNPPEVAILTKSGRMINWYCKDHFLTAQQSHKPFYLKFLLRRHFFIEIDWAQPVTLSK